MLGELRKVVNSLGKRHTNSKLALHFPYFAMQISSSMPCIIAHAVVTPHRHDILCGSGALVVDHPGNVRFRAIVENKAQHYARASTKGQKSNVIRSIISEVRSTGARVLTKYPLCRSSWCLVLGAKGDKILRDKITYYLRACLAAMSSPSPNDAPGSIERGEENMLLEDSKLHDKSRVSIFLQPPRLTLTIISIRSRRKDVIFAASGRPRGGRFDHLGVTSSTPDSGRDTRVTPTATRTLRGYLVLVRRSAARALIDD